MSDKRRFQAGRVMAAATFALTAYGLITLLSMRRADHMAEGVAMLAVFAIGFASLTWLSVARQPGNRALWVPAWASLLSGLGVAGWATTLLIGAGAGLDVSDSEFVALSVADLPTAAAMSWALVIIAAGSHMALMITLWPLLFPHGRLPSPRWRWVAWGAVLNILTMIAMLVWLYRPGSHVPLRQTIPEGVMGSLIEVLYLAVFGWAAMSFVSLLRRQRRAVGEIRQQYRWVSVGTFLLLAAFLVVDDRPVLLTMALVGVALSVASYGVAVTKYRLYDIDLFISRTVVYGVLAAFIGAVYVFVVVLVGGALGSGGGGLALAVVATALVAMAFEPLRRRAQRWANRLVYGKRATPYEVLSDLTRRLAGTEPAQGVLKRMARLMAEGTGAEQAAVWLADDRRRLVAAAGWPGIPDPAQVASAEDLAGAIAPVTHEGELVGVLQVVKSRGNPVTPPEEHLIDDLAGSAGLVLGNQRLNTALASRAEELQQSRRRLVEMQDGERRRLERDLHDGAQQQVIALKLKIVLAQRLAQSKGAAELSAELGELAAEAQRSVDEIRALAKGIYPPLLESESLVAAIKAQAVGSSVPVEISADGVGRYPRDVESAVYFAAVEAMTNAVTHGEPSQIAISVTTIPGQLLLEVRDDGTGFDPGRDAPGAGLVGIRDRVEALGGELIVDSAPGTGTTLVVSIPLESTASADASSRVSTPSSPAGLAAAADSA